MARPGRGSQERCIALTKSGNRCSREASDGPFCYQHDASAPTIDLDSTAETEPSDRDGAVTATVGPEGPATRPMAETTDEDAGRGETAAEPASTASSDVGARVESHSAHSTESDASGGVEERLFEVRAELKRVSKAVRAEDGTLRAELDGVVKRARTAKRERVEPAVAMARQRLETRLQLARQEFNRLQTRGRERLSEARER